MKQLITMIFMFFALTLNAQTNEVFIKYNMSEKAKIAETYLIENSVKQDTTKSLNNNTFEFWTRTKVYIIDIRGVRYNNVNFLVRNIIDCENKVGNTYDIIVTSESGSFISGTNFDNSDKSLEPLGDLLSIISKKICYNKN